MGRESACNAGDAGDADSIPGSGRFPGEEAWHLTQLLSGESHGTERSLNRATVLRVAMSWTQQATESAQCYQWHFIFLLFHPQCVKYASSQVKKKKKKKKTTRREGAPEPPRFTSSSSKEWRKSFSLCHSYHLPGRRIFPSCPSRFSLSSHCPCLSQMPTTGPCSAEGKKDDGDWLRVRQITIASGPGTMLFNQEEASLCKGEVVSVGQIANSIYHVPERV